MLPQMLAVFLVLGLLLAALWLLRRQGIASRPFLTGAGLIRRDKKADRHMRVVERLVLTPHHSLHLVSIENRLVVFAASPTGCVPVNQVSASSADTADGGIPLRDATAC